MGGRLSRPTTSRRRHLVWGAALFVMVLFAVQYVRAKFYVSKMVRDAVVSWVSIHTDWYVASPEDIEEQISNAKAAWPFAEGKARRTAPGPLRVLASNPRYFTDGSGRAVLLAGLHTWSDFQDNGGTDPPQRFDYDQFLDFLNAHHHNFFRLWVWENSRWTLETKDDGYWFHPMGPYERTGPGTALDGKPKWDLTRFDQAYFDRLRARVVAAGHRGIYVSIMLFQGWSVANRKGSAGDGNPWHSHPFNKSNNINGIDGDDDGDDSGVETQELREPRILEIQESYVKKVIDTVGDLDNVLYEISNESDGTSTEWQYHMILFIKAYETDRPQQHPVGMTAQYPGGSNEVLYSSDADWISPLGERDPHASDGSKVIINDTDHVFGIGGDRAWAWKSFTRGMNVLFMDGYDGAGYGVGGVAFNLNGPTWVSLRRNLGYIRAYAERMDLAGMSPHPELCSTTYCLARPDSRGAEYLVYAPTGGEIGIDLTAVQGSLNVEWFSPTTTEVVSGSKIDGGALRLLSPPFEGDAVLYLHAGQGASAGSAG